MNVKFSNFPVRNTKINSTSSVNHCNFTSPPPSLQFFCAPQDFKEATVAMS